jgi:hypothetical protein
VSFFVVRTDVVAIKPAPDGDGVCLFFREEKPVWFAHEHHAVNYAETVYPTFPILIFESRDVVGRRIEPRKV